MDGEQHPARVALRAARERVIERLSQAFAVDQLGLDEFETRVDAAYRCRSSADLTALVVDLAPLPLPSESRSEGAVVEGSEIVPVRMTSELTNAPRTVGAFLGNVERSGRFVLTNHSRALAVLGNIELDLRDLVLPDGVTHLHLRAVLGNIEITVPPELAVECEGMGVLGSFTAVTRVPAEGDGGGPLLRITGTAVLGSVEIRTRPRGVELHAHRAASAPKALPLKR